MEFLFSLFVVPTYEPSEMLCEDLLTTLQSVHRIAAMNTYRDRDTSPQVSRAVAEENTLVAPVPPGGVHAASTSRHAHECEQ